MPDIRIQYRGRVGLGNRHEYDNEELYEFTQLLRRECAERFSVGELPLSTDDFSLYEEKLTGMSRQTHDVIIRITLHHFPERVGNGDVNASELAAKVADFLNTERMIKWRGRVTVGVSLVFAEVAWGTA